MTGEKARVQDANRRQGLASDPAVSAWVRANAGTGKTYVLVNRILRLLLAGNAPASLLCLTFTKNAAAEMDLRVQEVLAKWAVYEDDALTSDLEKRIGRAPLPAELTLARSLFATVVDAPSGLPIMTIHSFCERILKRYSLEAGVPPGFQVLTEGRAADMLDRALARTLERMPQPVLDTLAGYAGEKDFASVLNAFLCSRQHVAKAMHACGSVAGVESRLRTLLGLSPAKSLSPGEEIEATAQALTAVLRDADLREVCALLEGGSTRDHDAADRFRAALVADGNRRMDALREAFCTAKNEPRSALFTAATMKRNPPLAERITAAQKAFCELDQKLAALRVLEATGILLRLGIAIFDGYEDEKRAAASVDFDDLTEKTLSLLSRPDGCSWVLRELDARLDHILIDEAQDTSPVQWNIIERLTGDFFAGDGAREDGPTPTLFAVGDEKQSIYGFQGADPDLLRTNGERYRERAQAAGMAWRDVDLNLSFRTLQPVLDAVDRVCGVIPALSEGAANRHIAHRDAGGGFVEVWEPEAGEAREKPDPWMQDDAGPRVSPAQAVANAIADRIASLADGSHSLTPGGKPVSPGDVLILLRKRASTAFVLQQTLQRRGLPVAPPDRIALLSEIAVMDLLALCDWTGLPEDDLSLAVILKSPLFGFDEEALFNLAHARSQSLWHALCERAETDGAWVTAQSQLAKWLDSGHLRPFDFLMAVLHRDRARSRFAARIGPGCHDAIDELLSLAQNFDGLGGLAEFAAFVRAHAGDVKREMSEAGGAVRIMTVHAAKGLEAPIVFLADTCSEGGGRRSPLQFVPQASLNLPVWCVKGASRLAPIAEAKRAQDEAEAREASRLLYVAMTRARDRLYIAGFHGPRGKPKGCWHSTVCNALGADLAEQETASGRKVRRFGLEVQHQPAIAMPTPASETPLPTWATAPVLPPKAKSVSVDAIPVGIGGKGQSELEAEHARQEGLFLHRLFEVLPSLPEPHRKPVAETIARAYGAVLPQGRIDVGIASALRAIADPRLAQVWTGSAEAEIVYRDGAHIQTRRVDRFAISDGTLAIYDYKSGARAGERAETYAAQLEEYRRVLGTIFPGLTITTEIVSRNETGWHLARVNDAGG
jgi:ATP-dependent helicase/nuclease subunit A